MFGVLSPDFRSFESFGGKDGPKHYWGAWKLLPPPATVFTHNSSPAFPPKRIRRARLKTSLYSLNVAQNRFLSLQICFFAVGLLHFSDLKIVPHRISSPPNHQNPPPPA